MAQVLDLSRIRHSSHCTHNAPSTKKIRTQRRLQSLWCSRVEKEQQIDPTESRERMELLRQVTGIGQCVTLSKVKNYPHRVDHSHPCLATAMFCYVWSTGFPYSNMDSCSQNLEFLWNQKIHPSLVPLQLCSNIQILPLPGLYYRSHSV